MPNRIIPKKYNEERSSLAQTQEHFCGVVVTIHTDTENKGKGSVTWGKNKISIAKTFSPSDPIFPHVFPNFPSNTSNFLYSLQIPFLFPKEGKKGKYIPCFSLEEPPLLPKGGKKRYRGVNISPTFP